jgi:hypothetical protein
MQDLPGLSVSEEISKPLLGNVYVRSFCSETICEVNTTFLIRFFLRLRRIKMRKRSSETEELERQPLIKENAPTEEETAAKQKQKMLIISFLLMVVFALGNKIFQKLQTIPMHNYVRNVLTSFFLNALTFSYSLIFISSITLY